VHTVKHRGCALLEQRIAGPVGPLCEDHIVSLAPLVDQQWNDFGRVLQVNVNRDRGVSLAIVQPGGHGGFLAEIARQVDDPDAPVPA
jgi:hypothetical protein